MRDHHSVPDKGVMTKKGTVPLTGELPKTPTIVNEIPRPDLPELHEVEGSQIITVNLPKPMVDPPPIARVLILDKVYVQLAEQDTAQLIDFNEGYSLGEGEEQVCQRTIRIGTDWKALAPGMWIEHPSLVIVRNMAGTNHRQTNPTEQQKKEVAEQILEVGLEVGMAVIPFALLPPGRSLRMPPFELGRLAIRSRSGTPKYSVTLLPK